MSFDLMQYGNGQEARIQYFLLQSKELGVDRTWAITIATVSINETAGTWFAPRAPGSVLPDDCFPARPIIALERGNPRLADVVGSVLFPPGWTNDQEVLNYAYSKGYITTNNASAVATPVFGAVDSLKTPNNQLIDMLDWCIDNRKGGALAAFSIGPTQTWLALSPVSDPSRAGKGWFQTWDDLWKFVTATTVQQQYESGAWNYLFTNFKLTRTLQQCGVAENGCLELWLRNHQTGNLDWTNPRWSDYVAKFAKNRDYVYGIADTVWPE